MLNGRINRLNMMYRKGSHCVRIMIVYTGAR